MPEPTLQISHPLTTRQERKELLVLACEVDRASWHQACHPIQSPAVKFARETLSVIEMIGSFVPGRVGRWLRHASFLTTIGRQLGWLRL